MDLKGKQKKKVELEIVHNGMETKVAALIYIVCK
jgi:hypothetical protein